MASVKELLHDVNTLLPENCHLDSTSNDLIDPSFSDNPLTGILEYAQSHWRQLTPDRESELVTDFGRKIATDVQNNFNFPCPKKELYCCSQAEIMLNVSLLALQGEKIATDNPKQAAIIYVDKDNTPIAFGKLYGEESVYSLRDAKNGFMAGTWGRFEKTPLTTRLLKPLKNHLYFVTGIGTKRFLPRRYATTIMGFEGASSEVPSIVLSAMQMRHTDIVRAIDEAANRTLFRRTIDPIG